MNFLKSLKQNVFLKKHFKALYVIFQINYFLCFLRKYNVPVNIYVTDIYFFVCLTVLSICVPCSCGTQGHLNMCYFDNINDKLETI